jgi:hypothetical protein
MLSPLPLIEPLEIMAGQPEIWDYWMEVFSDPQNVDSLALKDAVTGRPNKSEQSVHTSPWHTLELCPTQQPPTPKYVD